MGRSTVDVDAPAAAVWGVLEGPQAYAEWVVWTRRITRADVEWPRPGTSLDYEIGIGPVTVGDRTTVVEAEAPRLIVLRAELRRLGAIGIRIELEPRAETTQVVLDEEPVDGIARHVHTRISDFLVDRRNDEALRRLKQLAEARR